MTTPVRSRATALLAGVVLTATVLVGCSSDGTNTSNLDYGDSSSESQSDGVGAQPNADGGFDAGRIAPTPNAGVATQDPVVENGTTTQSFTIEGGQAEQVINDYVDQAVEAGWATAGAPVETGEDVWQAVLERDGVTLTATAGPSAGQTAGGQDIIELSIETTGN